MESIEFNKVLRRAVKKLLDNNIRIKIIYLSYSDNIKEVKKTKNKIKKLCGENKNIEVHTLILNSFKVSNNRCTKIDSYLEGRYLDHFCLNLIDDIRSCFKKEYLPRDITRHIGLISFFQKEIAEVNNNYHYEDFQYVKEGKSNPFLERKKNMYFESKEYFLERTIFEVIHVVIKNNGIIQPKESLKKINRIGIYFNLYVKKHRKIYADKGSHLSSESISAELSFYDILQTLCLKSALGTNDKEIFKRSFSEKIKERNFKSIMKKWIKDVEKLKKYDFYKKHEHQAILKDTCLMCLNKFKFSYESIFFYNKNVNRSNSGDGLIKSESISLYPNYNDVQLNIISKIDSKNIIPTNLSLNYRYRSMFMDPLREWNKLHIVSDRALVTLNVLKDVKHRGINYNHKKKIFAILSDTYLKNQLLEIVSKINNLSIKIFEIPYYDHSRHIALFTSEKMSHTRAIYYYKKGFSNNINAVYLKGLSNRDNINMFFQTFRQYLAKSIVFMSSKNSKNGIRYLPHFTQKNQINQVILKSSKILLTKSDKRHFIEFDTLNIRP